MVLVRRPSAAGVVGEVPLSASVIVRGRDFLSEGPWGAQAMCIPKPKGPPRFVHNFKPLNRETIKAAYPVHDMETDLDDLSLGSPKIYCQPALMPRMDTLPYQ